MKRKITSFLLVGVLFMGGSAFAVAQSDQPLDDPPTPTEIQEITTQTQTQAETGNSSRLKFDQNRQRKIEQHCEQAQAKVGTISDRISNLKDNRARLYANVMNVLNKFIERLNGNGVDTTALVTDMAELETMVSNVSNLWDEYGQALAGVIVDKNCDENPQAFHESLEDAKVAKQAVHDYVKEIRDYIKDTIKVDLTAIKQQLKAGQDGSESED